MLVQMSRIVSRFFMSPLHASSFCNWTLRPYSLYLATDTQLQTEVQQHELNHEHCVFSHFDSLRQLNEIFITDLNSYS